MKATAELPEDKHDEDLKKINETLAADEKLILFYHLNMAAQSLLAFLYNNEELTRLSVVLNGIDKEAFERSLEDMATYFSMVAQNRKAEILSTPPKERQNVK